MSYLVLSCTGCGSPRVAEAANKTANCPRCGTTIQMDNAQVHARTDELAEARDAVGQINAHRADGELLRGEEGTPSTQNADARDRTDETDDSEEEPEGEHPFEESPTSASPRDAIDRALVSARSVPSQRLRVKLTAEGLTEELETFTEEDWVEAMQRLDVDEARAREHLRRLSQASEIAEPEHGVFRYIE